MNIIPRLPELKKQIQMLVKTVEKLEKQQG